MLANNNLVQRLVDQAPVALIFALVVAANHPLTAASLPAAARFTVGIEARTFDGAGFNVITLESQVVTLTAFTLGAWSPVADSSGPYGLTLQHQRETTVKLGISPLVGELVPTDPERWAHYLATMAAHFGLEPEGPGVTDSSQGETNIHIIGWPTREVSFSNPGTETKEVHLIAAHGDLGVAFILSGPSAAVEAAMRDFRFFLSRLERS